jgi:hypothetical protein
MPCWPVEPCPAAHVGVGFRTVKTATTSVWPEPRKKPRPRPTRLDPFKPVIDQMLRADLDAPRKERHTINRIFDRLVAEHGAIQVTYPMVRAYVAERRPQIRIEAGRRANGRVHPAVPPAGSRSRGRLRGRVDQAGRAADEVRT